MNIFKKIKSKISFNKKESYDNQNLRFHSGQSTVITTAHDPNVICKEIDPGYSGRLIALNEQIKLTSGAMAFANREFLLELISKQHGQVQEHIKIIEEVTIRYFSTENAEIKNPFGIAINTLSNIAFFYNMEKPLVFK